MGARLKLDGSMIPRTVRRLFDHRSEERISTYPASAVLGWRGREAMVALVNLSTSGAQIVHPKTLHIGETVTLRIEGRGTAEGDVRWVRDGRIGIHFATRLE